ncbi:MAG: lysoplasmalogenase [Candidatus Hydrogenedentes bacterium]|nr:lysoplasmalogenase [Candidatus Hydrogenedentota bacterium]
MSLIVGLIVFISIAVGLLLLFMSWDHYFAGIFKMFASTGFILLCVSMGGIYSAYGLAILVGLVLSWWGDLFLISKSPTIFMMGLVAFFLAHVAYCVAFIFYHAQLYPALCALGILLIPGAVLVHWLYPYLGPMRLPVLSYMGVITLMVSLAAATAYVSGHYVILLGAVIFYCSDVFVARDRFVHEGKVNGLIGLPLYYLGQVLLALTVAYAR